MPDCTPRRSLSVELAATVRMGYTFATPSDPVCRVARPGAYPRDNPSIAAHRVAPAQTPLHRAGVVDA
jgi:hypothetical protein